jgi:hypothetical protein
MESLSVLNSKLEAELSVSLSNQGINERINKATVDFLKEIFTSMLNRKLSHTSDIQSLFGDNFNRIRLLDSTVFQLPDNIKEIYKGSGGSSSKSAIKIQLEYDLKSGNFMHIEPCNGTENDTNCGSKYLKTIEPKDLCIRDLGYFVIKDFQTIENLDASYLSRLRSNIKVYTKNKSPEYIKNGQIKKQSIYQKVDLKEIMSDLKPGKTMELDDAYIGDNEKLKTRIIIYKLTDKQLKERIKKNSEKEKKKSITISERTKELMGINIYITNISKDVASKNSIHEIYSLRWQVEIIFKIWKSIFNIDQVKRVKIERFECCLYGKLITIMLCSLLAFKMRYLLFEKKKKEMSEIKAFSIIREYLGKIYHSFMGLLQDIQQVFLRILEIISKNGLKSKKGRKKTVFDILIVFPELDKRKKMAA